MQRQAHDNGETFDRRAWLLVLLARSLAPRAFDDVIAGGHAAPFHGDI